jgi:hypothetical protein
MFVVALLSVSFAAALTASSMSAPTSSGAYIYTDKANYAVGDTILVTLANKGTNYVSYTLCGGVFFSAADASGNELLVTNPLLGRPCSVGNLYLQQSISYKWDQTYFDRSGQVHSLSEGTYTVMFEGVTATFTVGKPSTTSGTLTVYTDKRAYALGETVTVTAYNGGKTDVTYGACNAYSFYDSQNSRLLPNDPLAPCMAIAYVLKPGEKIVIGEWSQYYYTNTCTTTTVEGGTGTTICAKGYAKEGSYTVDFQGATAKFAIGKPTETNGKLELYTSKRNYVLGESVEFIAYNGGNEPVYYGACDVVSVSDSTGRMLLLHPEDFACIAIAYSLNPGDKKVVGTWDQVYYECKPSRTPSCQPIKEAPGVYLADFNGAKTKFAIGLEANNQPPAPPTDKNSITIAFSKGWNMFSVPVYSWNGPICSPGERCSKIASYRAPVITENTCTPSKAWSYDDGKYARTDMNSIQAGVGYWTHASQDCKITFEGDNTITASDYSTSLTPGWNLIGAPMGSIAFSAMANDCRVTSGAWYYSYGEYQKFDRLDEGRAYWVKVANSCTLSMRAPVSAQTPPIRTPGTVEATTAANVVAA